jgi:hypothetical protein
MLREQTTMSTELIRLDAARTPPGKSPHLPAARTADVLEAWLSARNPRTLEGYRRDLVQFAEWPGAGSADAAVEQFLSSGPAGANRIALAYRAALVDRGLASATIAR